MPKWLRRIIALGGASFVVLILVVGGLAYFDRRQPPAVEFDSVQDVGDHITGFYSVALDRADIDSGTFELDVYPGKKIAFEAAAPRANRYTIEGEREVTYKDSGSRIVVETDPDRQYVTFVQNFPAVTSTLRVLMGEQEIEVPITIAISGISKTFDEGSATADALLALDAEQDHSYVVRVEDPEGFRRWTGGGVWADSEASQWIVEALHSDTDGVVSYLSLRGLIPGLEMHVQNMLSAERDLAYERHNELKKQDATYQEIQDAYGEVADACYALDDAYEYADCLEGVTLKEYQAARNTRSDELFLEVQKQVEAERSEWLNRFLEAGQVTPQMVMDLTGGLNFNVRVTVLSIDGIAFSG